ncbi:MAG: TonB-dependent receptor [Pseudomonadota bacterium]
MRFISCCATAALLCAGLTVAQEDATSTDSDRVLETVQVLGQVSEFGASKSVTPIMETSRSISIETEDLFIAKGALTLADVLEYTAGVQANNFGPATRGDSFKVRGFESAEYRDGQQTRFGSFNTSRTDVYLLEQVEILKGPASVLYGRGTPGGLVNMVSKVAGPDQQNEIVLEAGTQDRLQIAGDYNQALGENIYARLVGVFRESDSFVDEVNDDALILMPSLTYDNGPTRLTAMVEYQDRDSDTSSQFLPLTGTACVDGNVTVTPIEICANSDGRRIDNETYHGAPGFNTYDPDSIAASILASHAFSDNISIDGFLTYKDAEVDYRQAYGDFLGTGIPRIGALVPGLTSRIAIHNDAVSEQFSADLRARFAFETGVFEHEMFIGFAYQDVAIERDLVGGLLQDFIDPYDPNSGVVSAFPIPLPQGIPDFFFESPASLAANPPPQLLALGPLADFRDEDEDFEDYGVYLNNQISYGALKVNIGLRYDEAKANTRAVRNGITNLNDQSDEEVSFSIGALYGLDNGLSPYLSYAESFEPVIGTDTVTGDPLQPQDGEQWEVGVKYQPPGTQTFFSAAYFDIEQSNLPNPQALLFGTPASQQEGIATSKGFEFEAYTALGDWSVEANLSFLDTEDAEGNTFSDVAENQASGWIQYDPAGGPLAGFSGGVGLRWIGERESNAAIDFDPTLDPTIGAALFALFGVTSLQPVGVVPGQNLNVTVDATVLTDALLRYEADRWSLSLNARNLFDEDYYSNCLARGDCFPGAGRSVVGRLAVAF